MEMLLRELHCGLRILTKSPGFAAIAVLTLSLGTGLLLARNSARSKELAVPVALRVIRPSVVSRYSL